MSNHAWILFLTMLVSGAFGGIVNYFLNSGEKHEWGAFWKAVVIGIGAAFLVPVFLNMISSDLLAQTAQDSNQLLVFAGFALIASISSRSFISNISQKVLKEAQEAKKEANEVKEELASVQSEVAPIVERETEHEILPETGDESSQTKDIPLSENEMKVLKALGESKFTLRSIVGLSKDSGLDKESVTSELNNLIYKELAVQTMGKKGLRWYVTQTGRTVIASFNNAPNKDAP